MQSADDELDVTALIATAADVCLKPWRHAVVMEDSACETPLDDLSLRIECRDGDGVRFPEHDLELEIFRSGAQINLTLCWSEDADRPLLWHGQHPVWMSALTGERCAAPEDGAGLESLGRRLRALLVFGGVDQSG